MFRTKILIIIHFKSFIFKSFQLYFLFFIVLGHILLSHALPFMINKDISALYTSSQDAVVSAVDLLNIFLVDSDHVEYANSNEDEDSYDDDNETNDDNIETDDDDKDNLISVR